MASVTVAECVRLPLVPVMTSVKFPTGVAPVVVTVSVEVPEPFTDVGEKLAVAPDGRPLTPNVTLPVKPLSALTFTEYVVAAPGRIDCEPGVAASEKSGTVGGGASSTKLNCWLAWPFDGHWSSCVPGVVLAPVTSR